MLSDASLERILAALPDLRIGLIGDLFLDRYFDLDHRLTEPSIETGLDAYQVARVRSSPGALGTIINNLVALGVGSIRPIAIIGDDGEGYELRQALRRMPGVSLDGIFDWPGRRTPTYAKPMLSKESGPAVELNRIDIKNRTPTPDAAIDRVLELFEAEWAKTDVWIALDQVSEPDCGVVTRRVIGRLSELGAAAPGRFVLADSRERIHEFRSVCVKPNAREASHFPGGAAEFARQTGRPVFLTKGDAGMEIFRPDGSSQPVAAFPVDGPIDIVGAGDSTSAGIACAVAARLPIPQAAAFGNLVASITIQQLGTTGSATPAQVRNRWREVGR
jgi:sugar/nucleoside kinase (ribokinase family)